jgi:hypothetical protein
MKPRRLLLLIALTSLLVAPGRPRADDVAYSNGEFGFRISRPATWRFHEQPATGSITVHLLPPGSQGEVRAFVNASVTSEPTTPKKLQALALARIESKAEYRDTEITTVRIAGRDAPGIRTVYVDAKGARYRLWQAYLVAGAIRYVCQSNAPLAQWPKWSPVFDRIWKSLELTEARVTTSPDAALKALAARCGSEIAWAKNWAEASKRAREESRVVLVHARRIPAFKMADPAMAGLFSDPDVIDLVRERFVAMRFPATPPPPFVASDVYGLGPSTFGSALLLVDADGRVLDETFTYEPTSAFGFLLGFLRRHPRFTGPPVAAAGDRLERVARLVRRGQFERAQKLLGGEISAEAHALGAKIARMERQGPDALSALDAAAKAGLDEARIMVERGRVLLHSGQSEEGIAELARAAKEGVSTRHRPEALFWLAAGRYSTGDRDAASEAWRTLVADHADSRWAWRAAAVLTSTGYALGVRGNICWPAQDLLMAIRPPVAERLAVREAGRARRDAVAHLLATQRVDGSWIEGTRIARPPDRPPHDFAVAVTAQAARALLPHRTEPRVGAALDRAVAWCLRAQAARTADPDPVHFMDYSPWSDGALLSFFAAALAAGTDEDEALRRIMKDLVTGLAPKQRRGGGFSYFLTTDLTKRTQPEDQSISFTTAFVLHGILAAKAAGITVPDALPKSVAACLVDMHHPNGSFEYMRSAGAKGHGASPVIGAAGRGPLCAHALLRQGSGDMDSLRASLDVLMRHRADLGRERRKTLMHTGREALGSHYIMFDYATAAAAVGTLPEQERGRHRAWLIEDILACRLEDGSYMDNPILGRAFGAAMALHAFESLGVR